MKIVLAEDRQGQLHGERAFTSDRVVVGRDPAVCHYFVAQEQWPMVSRKHAEFRLEEGRCTVADANSRFGTFVNGQQISAPVEVRVGSNIQLGQGGPVLRVVSIEQDAADVEPPPSHMRRMDTVRDGVAVAPSPAGPTPVPAKPQPPPAPKPQPVQQPPKAQPPKSGPAFLNLTDARTRQTKRIELIKEVTRIGRDPEGEVVIDADAAVVSRRHAEIHKGAEQFALVDLKSFNGTLVNDQRITDSVPLFDGDEIQLGVGGPVLRLVD